MNTVSRIMLAAAASSLAISPVAAQAGTRASEGSSLSAPGLGRTAEGESIKRGASTVVLAILASGLIIAGIVSASKSKDKGQSPGR